MSLIGKIVYYKDWQGQVQTAKLQVNEAKAINIGDGFVEIVHDPSGAVSFIPMHNVFEVYLEQETSPPVKPAEDAEEAEDWVGSAR